MFETTFQVPYYGLDAHERVKAGLLLQFLQEAAALHAKTREIGVSDLHARGLTWVLRRYRINVREYPGLGGLTVRTWYEPKKNLMSIRAFEIRDAAGDIVADAWSSWIVVDLERGRPVRLDRALPAVYYEGTDPTGTGVEDSMADVGDDCDTECAFLVRRNELDLNGHTNHTVYFDWALETVPDEVAADYAPVELDAQYLASAMREEVLVRTKRTASSADTVAFSHAVLLAKDGTEAARLATTWRRAT